MKRAFRRLASIDWGIFTREVRGFHYFGGFDARGVHGSEHDCEFLLQVHWELREGDVVFEKRTQVGTMALNRLTGTSAFERRLCDFRGK